MVPIKHGPVLHPHRDLSPAFITDFKAPQRSFRCFRRSPQFYHPCILVGAVVEDEPVAGYNHRIIRVPVNSHSIEAGTYGGVRTGGGKIKDIEKLGRVTVPLEQHLDIVQSWVEGALMETDGGLSKAVFDQIEAQLHSIPQTPRGVESMQLDVFRAVIVNRMENDVFVYKNPSSFPW
jgi:hypothetical protein